MAFRTPVAALLLMAVWGATLASAAPMLDKACDFTNLKDKLAVSGANERDDRTPEPTRARPAPARPLALPLAPKKHDRPEPQRPTNNNGDKQTHAH